MTSLALQAIAQKLDATYAAGRAFVSGNELEEQGRFSRVSTDTRSIQPGDLFVALRGDRFDAHAFLDEAVSKHAGALVVEKHFSDIPLPQLIVKDTTWALGQIAKINRELFSGSVIGITGSCGKTTVKTLVHNILTKEFSVLATEGSLNNHIGVPLTLFQLQPEHEFAVIEMGASATGEIDYLAQLVLPDVALITNALLAHVEGFGSLEGVAQAKGEIYKNLKQDGIAIVNWNDPNKDIWLNHIGDGKIMTFAVSDPAAENTSEFTKAVDFSASNLVENSQGAFSFDLTVPDKSVLGRNVSNKTMPSTTFSVQLQLLGKHNVANALAAAACAFCVGASAADIKSGLEQSQAVSGRMQAHTGLNSSIVIDDSYNANPDSVKAAIDSLVCWHGKSILVLGDLGELGTDSQAMHDELGIYAKAAGIKFVFATGNFTKGTCKSFGDGAEHFEDHASIVQRLKDVMDEKSVVLVKGSRAAHMESVVADITTD